MMLKRLRKSRGFRKFKRDRTAIAALLIVGVYLLLSLWTITTNIAHNVGESTGAFTLEDEPLLGLLLRDRTADRVGPGHMAGLGAEQSTDRRAEQLALFLSEADKAMVYIERNPEASPEDLTDFAVGTRALAPVPPAQLRVMHAELTEAFVAKDSLLVQRNELSGAVLATERILATAQTLETNPPAELEEREFVVEELAFALEDLATEVEAFVSEAADPGALADVDTDALFVQFETLLDLPDPLPSPVVDEASIRAVAEAAQSRLDQTEADIIASTDAIEPFASALFPEPEGWNRQAAESIKLAAGTDRQGRSILVRALYSAKIAIQVGVVVGLTAVLIGAVLGGAAAYFGSWVDVLVNWLIATLSSIPNIVLLIVLAAAFTGSRFEGSLIPLYVAFGMTFWIGPARVIRGEVLKIRELEFVQAATALGYPRISILVKHVIPNTAHLMFINFALLFIGAVKGEVILTFLGLGLKNGASWGIMIRESASEVAGIGFFWQIGTATLLMFGLVLAFNILTDALQDAFDPKHVS